MTGFDSPILLGGLSGTGKTRVRRALAAHPALCLTRRTYLWPRYHGRFGDLADPTNVTQCLRALLEDPAVQALQPDADRILSDLGRSRPSYARLFGLLHEHHAERRGARRWGDQLGQIIHFADEVYGAYPDARILHLVRGPTAEIPMGPWPPWSRGRLPRETLRWGRTVWLARRNRRRYGTRYLVVEHVDLDRNPVGTLRVICDFLGEEMHAAMEASIRASGPLAPAEPPVGHGADGKEEAR